MKFWTVICMEFQQMTDAPTRLDTNIGPMHLFFRLIGREFCSVDLHILFYNVQDNIFIDFKKLTA